MNGWASEGIGHKAWGAWGQTTGEQRYRKAWGMGHEAWRAWGQVGFRPLERKELSGGKPCKVTFLL